jgi:hypothetical protein
MKKKRNRRGKNRNEEKRNRRGKEKGQTKVR